MCELLLKKMASEVAALNIRPSFAFCERIPFVIFVYFRASLALASTRLAQRTASQIAASAKVLSPVLKSISRWEEFTELKICTWKLSGVIESISRS
jgi:hypothetical protein